DWHQSRQWLSSAKLLRSAAPTLRALARPAPLPCKPASPTPDETSNADSEPSSTVDTTRYTSDVKRGATLIAFGLAGIIAAGIWYWASRPNGRDVRTAEILGRTPPEAAVAGPIVLAIAAAFTVLCGVIIYATQPAPRPVATDSNYGGRL